MNFFIWNRVIPDLILTAPSEDANNVYPAYLLRLNIFYLPREKLFCHFSQSHFGWTVGSECIVDITLSDAHTKVKDNLLEVGMPLKFFNKIELML